MAEKKINIIKEVLLIILISMMGCAGVVFSVLYINTFSKSLTERDISIISSVTVALVTLLTMLAIAFIRHKKAVIYKLFFVIVLLIFICTFILYLLKKSGALSRFKSVEDLRKYIQSFGNWAVILFILIQFLQVAVLPIPSFITVGAGVLLFGPFKSAIYGCIGIILGSITAYYIGRTFGVKVVRWLIGDDALSKALMVIEGKDKALLTFMFLFPFFPDDVLCFVSGITTIKPRFFISMIIVVRIITVFASSYSMNNSVIPYNTWWGIAIWCLFFVITATLAYFLYKKGDKIEKMFAKRKQN